MPQLEGFTHAGQGKSDLGIYFSCIKMTSAPLFPVSLEL